MTLKEVIIEESGKPEWEFPKPDPAKKWQRLLCPFCHEPGKKQSAAVNYNAGWFECFRCNRGISDSQSTYPRTKELTALLIEYDEQIRWQCRKVLKRFGKWLNDGGHGRGGHGWQLLWAKACEFVWGYAFRAYGGPNDCGMLDEWIAEANGDPAVVKSYLSRALYGDLMNYADAIADWKRSGGTQAPKAKKDPDTGKYVSKVEIVTCSPIADFDGDEPYLEHTVDYEESGVKPKSGPGSPAPSGTRGTKLPQRKYRIDVLERMLAENWGWKKKLPVREESDNGRVYTVPTGQPVPGNYLRGTRFNSWGRSVLKCDLVRNGLGPRKGHCEYCDHLLKPDDPWVRYLRRSYRGTYLENLKGEELKLPVPDESKVTDFRWNSVKSDVRPVKPKPESSEAGVPENVT